MRVPMGPKNPGIMTFGVFGLSHEQIEELEIRNGAEQIYGAFYFFHFIIFTTKQANMQTTNA